MKIFPIKTTISKTFKLIFSKKYILHFLIVGLVIAFISFMANTVFNYFLTLPQTAIPPILVLFSIFLCTLIYLYGFSYILSYVYNFCSDISNETLQDMKVYFKKAQLTAFPVLGSTLLFGLIMLGGILLLIIPGFIWSVKYFFTPIISALEGKKAKEALKESKSLVKGNFWQIIIRLIIFYLISSFPGLIISSINPNLNFIQIFFLPITSLFYIVLYNNLKYVKQNSQPLPQNSQGV